MSALRWEIIYFQLYHNHLNCFILSKFAVCSCCNIACLQSTFGWKYKSALCCQHGHRRGFLNPALQGRHRRRMPRCLRRLPRNILESTQRLCGLRWEDKRHRRMRYGWISELWYWYLLSCLFHCQRFVWQEKAWQ